MPLWPYVAGVALLADGVALALGYSGIINPVLFIGLPIVSGGLAGLATMLSISSTVESSAGAEQNTGEDLQRSDLGVYVTVLGMCFVNGLVAFSVYSYGLSLGPR